MRQSDSSAERICIDDFHLLLVIARYLDYHKYKELSR